GVTSAPRTAPASAAGAGVLVLVTGQFPEPNETFIVREAGELVRRGFDVTIFSLVRPPRVILDPDARRLVRLAVYPPRFRRVLAAFRGTSYSFTAHAYDIHARANRRQLPARIAGADRVVTCTAYNRGLLASLARDRVDADKVVLCHHGLELDAYAPGRARSPELIVGGASLHPKKGLDRLVAACARLGAQGVRFRCVLVGEGPERARLERQIRALGLAGRV